LCAALGGAGARIAFALPDGATLATTSAPIAARVVLRDAAAVAAVARRDHARPRAESWHAPLDFCAQRTSFQIRDFLRKYLWPGPVAYVDLGALVGMLTHTGLAIHEIGDDTLSYTYTVRDWARGLSANHAALASRFGEPAVRAFQLFFWASFHFLTTNRTEAYHLVAGRQGRRVAVGDARAPC
jgi:hypothetical protein